MGAKGEVGPIGMPGPFGEKGDRGRLQIESSVVKVKLFLEYCRQNWLDWSER